MLETVLERIAVALEKIAASDVAAPKSESSATTGSAAAPGAAKPGQTTSPKPVDKSAAKPAASSKPTAASTKKEPAGPSAEEVRKEAKDALIRLGSTDEAKAEIKQVCLDRGAPNVKELDVKHYAEVLEVYQSMGQESEESEDPGV